MAVKVTIEGTEKFKAKLHDIESAITSREADNVGRAGAQIIAQKARENVHVITGALKGTIRVEDSDEHGVAQAVAGGINGVDYADDEEYGNSRRPPHPYMRPAVDSSKSQVRTVMRNAVYALIRKAVR
jgi:HK97 gp10 family phage protein